VGVGCGELGAVTTGVGGSVGTGVTSGGVGTGVDGCTVGTGVGSGVASGGVGVGVEPSCRFFICLFLFLLFFWF
jgi:hypothetical protein